jgi:hypothetical protein
MNERVKALYDQSLIREHGTDYEGNPILKITIDQQKFAELIVQECVAIANRQFSAATGLDDRDCLTAQQMKQHFGVGL